LYCSGLCIEARFSLCSVFREKGLLPWRGKVKDHMAHSLVRKYPSSIMLDTMSENPDSFTKTLQPLGAAGVVGSYHREGN
jgi:hypothetical protein